MLRDGFAWGRIPQAQPGEHSSLGHAPSDATAEGHDAEFSASTCAFFALCVPTCRSENHRASFPFGSQQQAKEAFGHDLPTSRLMDYDISAGLSFLLMGFHRLEQPFCRRPRQRRQSSLTAFQARHDACEASHQPASAGPSALRRSSLIDLPLAW